MSKKYDCVDAAKLVMSLFVVAIHANLFNQALFPTIRLAVPVFFIFTGFFTFSKINKMPFGNRKHGLWKIEKRYMQLYLFWFAVLLPFTLYNRQYHTYGLPGRVLWHKLTKKPGSLEKTAERMYNPNWKYM